MFPYSKLFNGEDGVSHFKRMRFSEDSEVAQRWRVSNCSETQSTLWRHSRPIFGSTGSIMGHISGSTTKLGKSVRKKPKTPALTSLGKQAFLPPENQQ